MTNRGLIHPGNLRPYLDLDVELLVAGGRAGFSARRIDDIHGDRRLVGHINRRAKLPRAFLSHCRRIAGRVAALDQRWHTGKAIWGARVILCDVVGVGRTDKVKQIGNLGTCQRPTIILAPGRHQGRCWITGIVNASADDTNEIIITESVDRRVIIQFGTGTSLPLGSMTLETILGIQRGSTLHIRIELLLLRHRLPVALQNPENRDHERDEGEHDERPIPRLLHRISARTEQVEKSAHHDQQNNNAYNSLYGVYHKHTTFFYTIRNTEPDTRLHAAGRC